MSWHEVWHVAVLGVTLIAGASLAVVLLAPLVFETQSPGIRRARPWVYVLAALAVLLLVVEWLGIHGG